MTNFSHAWRPGGYTNKPIWGNQCWFLDYDNGNESFSGTDPASPRKYLDTMITKASAWDSIYVRPRTPDTAGGDPAHFLPSTTTANASIPYTTHGLSIIGTGFGAGKEAINMTRIQGAASATTSVLTVLAPYVNVEGITFKRGGSTVAGLRIEGQGVGGGGYAFGVSVNRCLFWKIGADATKGALQIDSAWHTTVADSWFEECAKGIGIHVTGSNTTSTAILGCKFIGVDTTIDADIFQLSGTITELLVDNCLFAHDIPALASGNLYNKYIDLQTASGLISNCCFGTETETIATNMDRSNCDVVNCWFTNTTNLNPNAD